MSQPLYLALRAEGLLLAGDLAGAAKCVDDGLDITDRYGELQLQAELRRLRGEIALRRGLTDEGEEWLRRSYAQATRQHRIGFALRSGTALARLWEARGDRRRGRRLLSRSRRDSRRDARRAMFARRCNFARCSRDAALSTGGRVMTKRHVVPPSLDDFDKADPAQRNRLLLDWLSDDAYRTELFHLVSRHRGSLLFPSRDTLPRERTDLGPGDLHPSPMTEHKIIRLVTGRTELANILKDDGRKYSNRIYGELGGGSFMLALDPVKSTAHGTQLAAFPPRSRTTRRVWWSLAITRSRRRR